MIPHTQAFGVYHWDTFDNETFLVGEADTLADAQQIVKNKYHGRIGSDGADKVDIVDRDGNIVEQVSVR